MPLCESCVSPRSTPIPRKVRTRVKTNTGCLHPAFKAFGFSVLIVFDPRSVLPLALEGELQRELHVSSGVRTEDLAQIAIIHILVRIKQVYIVEQVEGFPTELEILVFRNRKPFRQTAIQLEESRPFDIADVRSTEGVERSRGKRRGIEPQFCARIGTDGISDDIRPTALCIAQIAIRIRDRQRLPGVRMLIQRQLPSSQNGIYYSVRITAKPATATVRQLENRSC